MGRPPLGLRKQVNVRLPVDLVEQIDTARGPKSRDAWMERAARVALRPAAQMHEPDLKARVHSCSFTTMSRTEFKNGTRVRYFACACGAEEAR